MSDSVPANSGAQDTSTSQSEIDVLSEGAEDAVVPETTEEESTSTEEESTPTEEVTEEEETTEEEEEVPDEEELEDIKPEDEPTRPSWKTIKEKYPELAKDKDFRELYFRDKAYTDVFPTVAHAKEAASKADSLDALDATLVNGDMETIFKDVNEHVLLKISDKILPSLFKTNPQAFARATRPFLVDILHTVMTKANAENDENLKRSVRNISNAIFKQPDLPSRVSAQEDPSIQQERQRLEQERQGLFARDEQKFLNAADSSVTRRLESMVSEAIDPKNEYNLSSFVRQAITERTLREVNQVLKRDEALGNKLKSYHKLASRSGFPDEYKARMISASLERAKRVIPMLVTKHRNSALGKQSTKGTPNKKIVSETKALPVSNSKKVDTKKTSAEDFLNDRNIHYK